MREMQIDFEDHYIVYVVLILWMLCCCRGLLQTCGNCVQAMDVCLEASCCDLRVVLGVQDVSVCAALLRRVVIVFCFVQPLVLCAVRLAAKQEHLDWHKTLRLSYVDVRGASGNITDAGPGLSAGTSLRLVEVDYLLLAMPLAVATSLHCVLFTQWSHTLDSATAWDHSVSDSEEWLCYEMSYYVLVACMNWLLLALACREQTVLEVYYAGLALSMVMWCFMGASRFPNESAQDHWGATAAFSVLLLALVPVWDSMTRSSCVLSIAAVALHACCVCVLVLSHYLALGQSSVASICLTRFGVILSCSVFNMVVLALGDDVC